MATVELRPGDTLNIIWSSRQDTPLGIQEIESNFSFTYAELLQRLRQKGQNKSKRSGTKGARFSRVVSLCVNAIKKGHWSTGAHIEKAKVFAQLVTGLRELEAEEHQNITLNAKNSLVKLVRSRGTLLPEQKKELTEILQAMGLEAKS